MPSNNLDLRLRRGLKANAASSPLLNGTLNFITDTGEMFVDIDNQRVNITSVEFYNNTSEILALTSRAKKLYVAVVDQEMYTCLDGTNFIQISAGGGGAGGGIYSGTCATAATESTKVISIPSGQKFRLKTGVVVTVKFGATNSATNVKLNVNETGAIPVYYNNAVHSSGNNAPAGGYINGYTTYFYDGTYWVYFSHSLDSNTTYSTMTVDELITGTSTAARAVNAANLKTAIDQIAGGTVNNGKLTIKVQTGATSAATSTFSANQSTNTTATITVPNAVSQLSNDLQFTSNTGTVTSVSAATGLVTNNGSAITGSGTIKANLVSETKSSLAATSMGDTTNRQYAVGLDKNGKLSVNIPWENTTYGLSSTTTHGLMRQLKNDAAYFMNGKGQWAIPTDTTYPLVSTAGEGLAPKGNGSTTMFLDASGTYRAMTTATTANIGLMPKLLSNQNTKFLRADGTFAAIPNVTTAAAGLVSSLGGDATKFYNGTGGWTVPPGTTPTMTGANSTANGKVGYINAVPPSAGYDRKFWGANGAWHEPPVMSGGSTAGNGSAGYVPAPPSSGYSTKYLRADATWATIPNVTTGAAGLAPARDGSTTSYLRGDGQWKPIPNVTTGAAGLAPARDGSTASFLRGDGQWATPAGTVSAMKGATASASGSPGYIGVGPSTAGYNRKFWMANGTWSEPPVMVGSSTAGAGSIGYVPKPPSDNYTIKYLRADASWATIPNVSTAAPGLAPSGNGSTTMFLNANGKYSAMTTATTDNIGLMPKLKGNTTQYLRADGTFAAIPNVGTAAPGLAPSGNGSTTMFLNANGTYSSMNTATTANVGLIRKLNSTSSVDTYYLRGNGSWGAVTWDGTEAAYAALSSYDPTTIYFVHG